MQIHADKTDVGGEGACIDCEDSLVSSRNIYTYEMPFEGSDIRCQQMFSFGFSVR